MAAWFDPLLTLLADQPVDTPTVTLTLGDLAALATGPLPANAATRTYWWRSSSAPGRRLAAQGWRMVRVNRSARTLTFAWVGAPA